MSKFKLEATINEDGVERKLDLVALGNYDAIVDAYGDLDEVTVVDVSSNYDPVAIWLLAQAEDGYDFAVAADEVLTAISEVSEDVVEELFSSDNVKFPVDALITLRDCSYDDDEILNAFEAFGLPYAIDALRDGNFEIMPDVFDDEDLGTHFVKELGLPSDYTAYLDTDAMLEDVRSELDDDDDVDDDELLEQIYEVHDGDDDFFTAYFDYEAYGHDLYGDYTGGYTDGGFYYMT